MDQQQIQVKADEQTLQGKYTNTMQVAHTREEFVIDFFNIFPPTGSLVSRVVTNPAHFKRMIAALAENLQNYEEKFGTIDQSTAPEEKKIGFKTS